MELITAGSDMGVYLIVNALNDIAIAMCAVPVFTLWLALAIAFSPTED